MAVARLNRWGREIVRLEIRARVKRLLITFVQENRVDEFINVLFETRAGIAGSVALELLLTNSDWYNPMKDPVKLEERGCVAEPSPDLNILVPESNLAAWVAFLRKAGYHHQRPLGIGTCYQKAGVTSFTLFLKRESTVSMPPCAYEYLQLNTSF